MRKVVVLARLVLIALAVVASAFSAAPARAVTYEQLAGWWKATPSHGGRTTTVYVHFVEEEGKPQFKVSLPAIAVWDVTCGALQIDGDRIDAREMPFPLIYDAATKTLNGDLPRDAVPVYKIHAKFERCDAPEKPAPAT